MKSTQEKKLEIKDHLKFVHEKKNSEPALPTDFSNISYLALNRVEHEKNRLDKIHI